MPRISPRHLSEFCVTFDDALATSRGICAEARGYDWFLLFIALGDITPETVAIFNDTLATRIEEMAQREATTEPRDDARLSARSQAARRGEPLPEVQGLQHAPHKGHQLRSKAKMFQYKLQQHDQEWWY